MALSVPKPTAPVLCPLQGQLDEAPAPGIGLTWTPSSKPKPSRPRCTHRTATLLSLAHLHAPLSLPGLYRPLLSSLQTPPPGLHPSGRWDQLGSGLVGLVQGPHPQGAWRKVCPSLWTGEGRLAQLPAGGAGTRSCRPQAGSSAGSRQVGAKPVARRGSDTGSGDSPSPTAAECALSVCAKVQSFRGLGSQQEPELHGVGSQEGRPSCRHAERLSRSMG